MKKRNVRRVLVVIGALFGLSFGFSIAFFGPNLSPALFFIFAAGFLCITISLIIHLILGIKRGEVYYISDMYVPVPTRVKKEDGKLRWTESIAIAIFWILLFLTIGVALLFIAFK